jgi:hypothetical protein
MAAGVHVASQKALSPLTARVFSYNRPEKTSQSKRTDRGLDVLIWLTAWFDKNGPPLHERDSRPLIEGSNAAESFRSIQHIANRLHH